VFRLRIGIPRLKGVIALFEGQHQVDNWLKGSLVFLLRSGREGAGQNSVSGGNLYQFSLGLMNNVFFNSNFNYERNHLSVPVCYFIF